MPAAAWLRGRPDPALTDFWLDPRLPGRPLEALVAGAVREWDSGEEWAPSLAALGWRGDAEVLEAVRPLAAAPDPRARSVAAYVAGQLGAAVRSAAGRVGGAARGDGRARGDPEVLAVIAEAFGHLGSRGGSAGCCGCAAIPTRRSATGSSPRWRAARTSSPRTR